MEISAPLFNKILETNHLVKGRLHVKDSDLKKIYLALQKDDELLKNKLSRHETLIRNQISKRNAIRLERKHNYETLQKSFYPTTNKVSLLYKKQGESYYIKARFYWRSKQREVQVGSIPIIIEIINNLIANKILTDIKPIKTTSINWDEISKRPALINAIKSIASIKAQEYILRRLLSDKIDVTNKRDAHAKERFKVNVDEMQYASEDTNTSFEKHEKDVKGVQWYEKWRRDNL